MNQDNGLHSDKSYGIVQLSLPQAEQAEGQNRLIKLVSVGRLGPLKDFM